MIDITCNYEVSTPSPVINPNAIIEGVLHIKSLEKRDKRIKYIELQLIECFKKFIGIIGVWGSWDRKTKILDNWTLMKQTYIKSGEVKNIDFFIRLPSTWSPKIGTNLQDWHIALRVVLKVGSKLLNMDKCVLPVYNSSRPPSYTPPIENNTQDIIIKLDESLLGKNDEEKHETKICSYCGKKIKKRAAFCEFCGGRQ